MEGMNTQAPDTQTTQDTRNYTPSSAVDSIADILVDDGAINTREDEKSLHETYAPRGTSYEDMLEGFAQASREINGRDNQHDVEQSNYLPEENEGSDNDIQQASLPNTFDSPEKINQGIQWLEGEINQLNQALQQNIITPEQYQQGMTIAGNYAQAIQGAVLNAQQMALDAQKQEMAAHDYISQHIPEWKNEGNRQQTVKQMYNFLNSVGVPNEVIQRLPHTPEMAIFVHKLMKEHHRAVQIENKRLQKLNKQKAVRKATPMTERKPGVNSIHDQTNAVARLLMGLGGA